MPVCIISDSRRGRIWISVVPEKITDCVMCSVFNDGDHYHYLYNNHYFDIYVLNKCWYAVCKDEINICLSVLFQTVGGVGYGFPSAQAQNRKGIVICVVFSTMVAVIFLIIMFTVMS